MSYLRKRVVNTLAPERRKNAVHVIKSSHTTTANLVASQYYNMVHLYLQRVIIINVLDLYSKWRGPRGAHAIEVQVRGKPQRKRSSLPIKKTNTIFR